MSISVLIVEDESIVAMHLQSLLAHAGYTTAGMASSGSEAVALAVSRRPDIVLMDIELKGEMNGVEAAQKIRDHLDIPIIYVTAYSDPATLKRAKITGPYGYVLKPFDEREIYTAMEMALYKHRTDRELRESRQWLATTLKSIGDAVIATNKEGCIQFMNPIAEALTGWMQEEASGKKLAEVFVIMNEESRQPMENPVEKVLRDGAIIGLANHTLLLSRDGREMVIDDAAAPITNEKGDITGVVLTFRDVSAQNMTEKALIRSEHDYRNIFENAHDAVIILNPEDEMVLDVNQRACEIYGFSREEFIGMSLLSITTNVDYGKARIMETLEAGRSVQFESAQYCKDGSILYMDINASVIHYKDQRAILSINHDITERRRMNEELLRKEELLRTVVSNAPLALFATDQNGIYTLSMGKSLAAVGLAQNERVGQSILDIYKDVPGAISVMQKALQGAEASWSGEILGRIFESHLSPRLNEQGEPVGMIGVSLDVTDTKRAEETLRESEKRYRQVVENAQDIIYTTDIRGYFTYANAAVLETSGYSMEELLSYRYMDLIVEAYRERIRLLYMRQYLDKQGAIYVEFPFRTKSGEVKWFGQNSTLIFEQGKVSSFHIIGQDITERKAAEDALRQSEERFRMLIQNSSDAVQLLSAEGTLIYVSPAAERMLGYTPEEMIQRNGFEFVHPDDIERAGMGFAELISQPGAIRIIELRVRHKDGSWRWTESLGNNLLHEPAIHSIVVNYRDITERKLAEEALEATTQQLKILFDNLDEVFFSSDVEHNRTLQVSPACEKVYGFPPQALFDDPLIWIKVVHPDDLPFIEVEQRLLSAGHSAQSEYRIIHTSGEIRWIETKIKPTLNSEGKLVRVDGVISDITDRKLAQEEIIRSRNEIHSILEFSPFPIIISGVHDQRVRYINKRASELFLVPMEEAIGVKALNYYVHPSDRRKLLLALQDTLHIRDYEVQLKDSVGKEFWALMSVEVITFADTLCTLVALNDITARKMAEDEVHLLNGTLEERVMERTHQLIELNREKDDILAIAAHDLRNPLTGISMSAELLTERFDQIPTADIRRQLGLILQSSTRMKDILTNLLSVHSLESGKLILAPEKINIVKKINVLKDQYQQRTATKQITIHCSFEGEILAMADRIAVTQVLDNLISNAIKFSPREKNIWITAENSFDTVRIKVRDEGPGLSSSEQELLFRKYTRLSTKPTAGEHSTGLGLSIVKKLVEAMNGKVWCESVPGEGATFLVDLPKAL